MENIKNQINEDLWLKGILFDSKNLQLSDASQTAFIELVNPAYKKCKRQRKFIRFEKIIN